ncbi:UNVERIFIED_ORG: uncharacterized protein YqgC (DUF456 family) [Stenotrophomonas maltophilia]|jgi:uncharacterized protein YqgC (DUF456 family)|nr:hypothetical protein SRABI35_01543 [Stenotrophomonas lactitubi]
MQRIGTILLHQATIHGDLAKLSDCNLTRPKRKSNWQKPFTVNPKNTTILDSMDLSFILYLLAVIFVLIGIAGIVLPALPGIPLVFVGLVLAAWADGFVHVGWPTLLILGVLTALSLLVDVLATVVGAKRVGASRKALWGTFIGSIVGLFFMPIGLFAGPLLGALLGEYWHTRELGRSTKVGLATWLGILLGLALKLALVIAMLGLFAFAWFL